MINKKYKKKPVIIEAVQYKRDENISSCMDFCPDMIYNQEDNEYDIVTLEGRMRITKGDFIIKGVNGEFYPCKPDIFRKTYEEVAISKMETVEPCEWCDDNWVYSDGHFGRYDTEEIKYLELRAWHYCPNCGRRIIADD
jgi:hypothetical protein